MARKTKISAPRAATTIEGRIWKYGAWWLAEAPSADVMSQGKTRTQAARMLADAIESLVNQDGFKVRVKNAAGSGTLTIEATDSAELQRFVHDRQRQPELNRQRWQDAPTARLGTAWFVEELGRLVHFADVGAQVAEADVDGVIGRTRHHAHREVRLREVRLYRHYAAEFRRILAGKTWNEAQAERRAKADPVPRSLKKSRTRKRTATKAAK